MNLLDGAEADLHRLRGGRRIELGADAIYHPRSLILGGHCTTPYSSLTHVVAGPRGLRIGTEHGSFFYRRHHFEDRPGGPEALARALARRVSLRPGGASQLERMVELDQRMLAPPPLRVGPVLVAIAVVAFLLQLVAPDFYQLGFFSRTLVSFGEGWRFVTANLLHASLLHLLLNAAGLLVFGGLLERSLGAPVTVLVAAGGALGAMGASYLAGYESVVGASGIVYGLLGALLWVEFDSPARVPVLWRLPRRLFVGLLVAETVILSGVPVIAHGAHLGGFLGGGLVVALAAGPALRNEPDGWGRRLLASAVVGVLLYSTGLQVAAMRETEPGRIARRAEALMRLEAVPPQLLNNEAWRIAISNAPGERDLRVASELAERAVRETEGSDPTILDTLAEVYFQSGRTDEALVTIDAAIALAPDEEYYREQRRRFTGERDPEDRPAEPVPEGAPQVPLSDSAIRV